MKCSLFTLIYICYLTAFSQEVQLSRAEKFSPKHHSIEILGSDSDAIYVHKDLFKEHQIEVYSKNLHLKKRHTVLKKNNNEELEALLLGEDSITVFFSRQHKQEKYLIAKRFDKKFHNHSAIHHIDTMERSFSQPFQDWTFTSSKNKEYVLIFNHKDEVQFPRVEFTILDNNLNSLANNALSLQKNAPATHFESFTIDNDGQAYFTLTEYRTTARVNIMKYWLLISNDGFRHVKTLEIEPPMSEDGERGFFVDGRLEVDDQNNRLSIVGLFTKESNQGNFSDGIYYAYYDKNSLAVVKDRLNYFSPETLLKASGNRRIKKNMSLFSFRLRDVVLRADGGVLVVSESIERVVRERYNSSLYEYMYDRSGSENLATHYYCNLLISNISPDGFIEWEGVVPKNQVSSGDDGKFSSYGLINMGDKLAFLYNENINYRTNVGKAYFDGNGDLRRSTVLNTNRYDALPIFKKARQTAANQITVPGYKKGKMVLMNIAL